MPAGAYLPHCGQTLRDDRFDGIVPKPVPSSHVLGKVSLLSCILLLHRSSLILRDHFDCTESDTSSSCYSVLEVLGISAASVKMPKVTKKTSKEEEALRPVPTAMDTGVEDGPSTSGANIKFAPMSVFDQNGRKIEFRRVSPCYVGFGPCNPTFPIACFLFCVRKVCWTVRVSAGYSTTAEVDAPQNSLAFPVPAHHRAVASGHANEPEEQKGISLVLAPHPGTSPCRRPPV